MFQKNLLILLAAAAALVCAGKAPELNYFPIGAYCVDENRDVHFETLKAAGFNTVQSYSGSIAAQKKLLDKAQKFGMKVMLNLHVDLIRKDPDGMNKMREMVLALKDHPALGFWYLYDEPGGAINAEKMRPFYEMIRKLSPDVPISVALCWTEDWNTFSNVLDLQLIDHYPVHDEPFPTAHVQQLTTFVADARKLGKPVIPVVQIFSWHHCRDQVKGKFDHSKFRYPNFTELRYMVWGCMAQKVAGMYAFAIHAPLLYPEGRAWWNYEGAKVFQELRNFADLVKNPSNPEIFSRAHDGNWFAARFEGKEPGKNYLVLVNAWPQSRPYTKSYLDGKYADREYELKPYGNTRRAPARVKSGAIRVDSPAEPFEVFIWEMRPLPPANQTPKAK